MSTFSEDENKENVALDSTYSIATVLKKHDNKERVPLESTCQKSTGIHSFQNNPITRSNEGLNQTFSIIDISNNVDQNERRSTYVLPPALSILASIAVKDTHHSMSTLSEKFEDSLEGSPIITDFRSLDEVQQNEGSDTTSTKQTNEMLPVLPSLEAYFKVPEVLNISPPMQKKLSCIVNKLSPSITSRRFLTNRLQQQRINRARKVPVPINVKEPTSKQKPRKSAQYAKSTVKRKVTSGPIRLPMKTLRLSFNSPSTSKMDNGQTHDEVIQKMINPEPFFAYTTLDPFLPGNFYDEDFLDTHEKELIKWVDSILSPPLEHRLNCLRRAATTLLLQASTVLSEVKVAVDNRIISIRDDRDLHIDLGLQSKVTDLLLCYNPLWLRIGLEAIFGRAIPLRSNSDKAGLRNFIRKNVLSDDYIKSQNSHPNVPHRMLPDFEIKMKKFTLYKFLVLIYIMDLTKRKQLILHNPCLFCKNSPFKSSRDILIEFSKDLLFKMSDITKHLKLLKYEVSHKQTCHDEFNFSLSNRSELRDGVRLTRLAEMIVDDKNLCSQLLPSCKCRAQKVQNVEIALTALNKAGYEFSGDITKYDIADGHREKTLSLIWQLRGIIQKRAVKLIILKWRETKQLRKDRKDFLNKRWAANKIKTWYKKTMEQNMNAKNNCEQMKIDRSYFIQVRAAVIKIQAWWRRCRLARSVRNKFKEIKTAVVKIQRFYRSYIPVRRERTQFLAKKSAALVIQNYYRNYLLMKMKSATIILQKYWRSYIAAKTERSKYLHLKSSTIKIQQFYRRYRIMKLDRSRFLTMKSAALKIQRFYRSNLVMRNDRAKYLMKKSAAKQIQEYYINYKAMKLERFRYLKMKSATIILQKYWRSYIAAKTERSKYLHLKSSTIKIQQFYRRYRIMKLDLSRFLTMKLAALKIQRFYRNNLVMRNDRAKYLMKKSAAKQIQQYFRGYSKMKIERLRFLQRKSAAVTIQRCWRERVEYLKRKSAAHKIQMYYKNYKAIKLHRSRFLKQKSAAVLIQAVWRGYNLRKNLQTKKPEKSLQSKDHKSLRHRFNAAVFELGHELGHNKISPTSLTALDTVTLLSSQLCEDLVEQGLVKTLYRVFDSACGRSPVDLLACGTAIMVLVNLYKHAYTATAVWKTTVEVNGIQTLVNILMKSYSKNPTLFCNTATLLWLFAHNNENLKVIKNTHNVLQTLNYISNEMKKKKKDLKKEKEKHTIPDTKPDWGKYGDKPKVFLDKDFALENLLKKMDIK